MFIMKNRSTRQLQFIAAFILLIGFLSCGFAYEMHVTGRYYIIGVDTKEDLGLSYDLSSGGYIGKAPGQILQYGFDETYLVVKTLEQKDKNPSFYIINMTKDAELAREEEFRIGPISEDEYNETWEKRLNIVLKELK